MPLEQSTPPSSRRHWQGTRTSFVDVVRSLERCMQAAGLTGITLNVAIGGHEGNLASPDELRTELTEALWLGSQSVSVRLSSSHNGYFSLGLRLELPEPVLFVVYHGGTPHSRETLRAMVERALPPERRDPRRRWRSVGPIVGCAYAATLWVIGTRLPVPHLHLRASPTFRDALGVISPILNVAVGTYCTWFTYDRWFPPLERLPDTAQSSWDRRRGWLQVCLGLWVTLVVGLLALPPAH